MHDLEESGLDEKFCVLLCRIPGDPSTVGMPRTYSEELLGLSSFTHVSKARTELARGDRQG